MDLGLQALLREPERATRLRGPARRRYVPGGRGCKRLRSKAAEDHRLGT